MSKPVEIWKALATELTTRLASNAKIKVARRYMPCLDATELGTDLWVSIYLDTVDETQPARGITTSVFTYGIAVQYAMQGNVATDADGNTVQAGIDSAAEGDAVIDLVQQIKGFWNGDPAPLQKLELAGAQFAGLVNDPMIEPFSVTRLGIITSIIEIDYRFACG